MSTKKMRTKLEILIAVWLAMLVAFALAPCRAVAQQKSPGQGPLPPGNSPVILTLEEAIHRAQLNEPNFATAVANQSSAALDRSIARSALLPTAIYHNQYVYTQTGGSTSTSGQAVAQGSPRFIASNGAREYVSQAQVNETLGLGQIAAYRRAGAVFAQLTAEREIARRGLVANVVNAYYTLLASDQKQQVSIRSAAEAQHFLALSMQLEAGREVAHADVVKATLQAQQRDRDLADAQLASQRARLELGVLLFPDPRTAYTLADDSGQPPPLPLRGDIDMAAAKNNPELKSALAAVAAANQDITVARAGYLPSLSLNYTYGIDAPQFALNGPGGVRNLGYSASGTLDIPVWDWLATRDRVKQSELRRSVATTTLNYTQRRLLAQLEELYGETHIAVDALLSLEKSVGTARESLRLTNLRYSAAEATALEVVDAQNAVIAAETARADGIVRYRLALANLQTLTGNMP